MIDTPTNAYTIDKAGKALGQWLITAAHRKARDLGFSYEPMADAPNTYEGVQAAYKLAQKTRTAFPVWSGGSDHTIYQSPEANYAFRYLHDTTHVEVQGDFSPFGESMVALSAAKHVIQAFGDSLETRIYLADSLGQVAFNSQTGGRFPEDQAAFVRYVVLRGVGLGVHAFVGALPGFVAAYRASLVSVH